MKKLNDYLALRFSWVFATMMFFWFCNALALLPLAWPASLPVIQFISSGWLQLVALPLLAVSARLQGQAAETRAQQDHAALIELVQALHSRHDELAARLPRDPF